LSLLCPGGIDFSRAAPAVDQWLASTPFEPANIIDMTNIMRNDCSMMFVMRNVSDRADFDARCSMQAVFLFGDTGVST